MHESMDFLYDYTEEVEKHVFFETANLFNLKVDLIFYDTTTASFLIDQEDDLRRFGHSKESTWSPQVVVALAVTTEGLPVKSWIFPGNTADVSTIEKVRSDLRGWKLNRAIFVTDSAINSKNNREELARACGKYLLANRIETNDDTINLEDTACGYKGLMVIERCFRSLKRTRIKMSPIHHWASRRIEAHVKICVLALLIERLAQLRCDKPWSRIKQDLEELQIFYFSTAEHRFFRRNEITGQIRSLLNSLDISPPKFVQGLEKLP